MKNPISKNGSIKIIQISDTHLFSNNELEMYGTKSNLKFLEVIDKIILEDIVDTDMIFLTGDISQDETESSYQKVIDSLEKLNVPAYWIPGNHDNILTMQSVFNNAKNFKKADYLSLSNWDFIFLNTKIEGSAKGFLAIDELNALKEKILKLNNEKKIAIVMHHHPAEVGTPLIDNYILQNKKEFWDIVTNTKVKLIICGHVHGDYKFNHNNIMIESTPATCLQWEKETKDLKIDARIGYKIYYFDADYYTSHTKIWL